MAAVRRYTGNKGIDAAASPARPRWKLVVRCPPRAPRRLAGCAGRAGRTRGAGHIGRTHEGGCGADCARTRSRSRPRKPHTVERMSAAVRGGSPETIQQIGPASPMALSFFLFLFLFFSSFFLLYFCFFLLFFSFPFLFNFPFSLFLFLFYFLFLCLFLYFILFYYFQLFHFLFLFFFIFFSL
jgi:hypothetical protein